MGGRAAVIGAAAIAALAALAPGCGDDLAPALAASVEVGTGLDHFEAIDAATDLDLVLGAQGGRHVVANLRVEGIDPGDPADLDATAPRAAFRVYTADDMRPIDFGDLPPFEARLIDDGTGADRYTLDAGRLVYIAAAPEAIVGRRIVVAVDLVDELGVSVHDARTCGLVAADAVSRAAPAGRAPPAAGPGPRTGSR